VAAGAVGRAALVFGAAKARSPRSPDLTKTRARRRIRQVRAAVAIVSLFVLAGCGGHGSTGTPRNTGERLIGTGADAAYVLFPAKRPWRSVVVYFHGHGDADEITPVHHRPFLDHVTARGTVVVYPTYEIAPGGSNAASHALKGVQAAVKEVSELASLPALGIGYSRGGHLVVDYAAIAPRALKPKAILSLMPASSEDRPTDLRSIPKGTRIHVVVADHDEVVGIDGALALIDELGAAGFRRRDFDVSVAKTVPGFRATHLSVFQTSAPARRAYWAPADRLLETLAP
jgi:predicted esterase